MATGNVLETTRFGASGQGMPDNFDDWARHSPNHILRRGQKRFTAEANFWQLDRLIVTEQWLGAFVGERTSERMAAAPTNQITLVVLLDATMTYQAGGKTEIGQAGDIMLLDFQRLYRFKVSAGRTVTISLDRTMIEDESCPLQRAGRLPHTPETSMLADFVGTLLRHLPTLAADNIVHMASILRRMVTMALARGPQVVDPKLGSKRAAALRYIERQPPGRLDVAAMADALNLTRSTLYRLFRNDGGVLAYDRRRRLRLLHRRLCEDATSIPLGELGAQYGFLDLSNLSRQFRTQFGLPMSDVRKLLLPPPMLDGDVERYRAAIKRFE